MKLFFAFRGDSHRSNTGLENGFYITACYVFYNQLGSMDNNNPDLTNVVLETNRLVLKGISPADIHHAFSTCTPAEIKVQFGLDDDGFFHYQQMHEKGMETFRLSQFSFLLTIKESGKRIGECGFHTWNRTHRRSEIFYFLRSDSSKKKGYMKEALPVVIRFGFETLALHRIEALVAADNVPSIRLLKENGFTFEGTMREDYVVDGKNEDSDCYSLLKTEWQVRQPAN